tara:strand:+ start:365 stop:943 length:579 start_codon:yes stop_codon:yes gene_type:complete
MSVKITKPNIRLQDKINLNYADTIPVERMPLGSIIQTVHNKQVTSGVSNSSTSSWSPVSGMYVDIKPRLPGSRIMIHCMINSIYGNYGNVGSSSNYNHLRIYRVMNSTSQLHYATGQASGGGGRMDAELQRQHNVGEHSSRFYQVVDNPHTTMTVRYQLYYISTNTHILFFNDTNSTSSMTAYEIKYAGDDT